MNKAIPAQHPAVVLRSQYRQLRSLLAVMVVAVVGLSTTVVILTVDDQTATTATTTQVPTAQLDHPLQSRTAPTHETGKPDESAVAAAIASQPPVVGPDESRIAAAIGSQPTPASGPDESKIAAAIAERADTGSNARARAWQEKLDSMTPQQRAQVFGSGY